MDPAKEEFIVEQVEFWAEEVDRELKKMISRFNIGVTDDLLHSLKFQVVRSMVGTTAQYELSFLEYGRMIDMGAGAGVKANSAPKRKKVETLRDNQKLLTRRPKKFYSKTTYGMLNGLIEKLMFGYQEQTVASLKNQLI